MEKKVRLEKKSLRRLYLTSDEHDDDGEDLLVLGVGGDVPEADGRQRGESVVEGGDVGLGVGNAAAVGEAHPLGQEV